MLEINEGLSPFLAKNPTQREAIKYALRAWDGQHYTQYRAIPVDPAFLTDRLVTIVEHFVSRAVAEIEVPARRTDAQIVEQTNDLARIILRDIGTGYEVPAGYKFYEERHGNSRARKCWRIAVEIMEHMTQTNADDALSGLEPEEAPAAPGAHAAAVREELAKRPPAPNIGVSAQGSGGTQMPTEKLIPDVDADFEEPEEPYPSHLADIFKQHGLSVEHKGKVYSTLGINGFFDVIDRAILHSQPTEYRDPARDASAAMRNRMATLAMERLECRRSDDALKQELRKLAATIQKQADRHKAREAEIRSHTEAAQAHLAEAAALLRKES